MLRIAICDNCEEHIKIIQHMAQQYFKRHNHIVLCETFTNAFDFLDAIEKKQNYDIFFLDARMSGILGIELAAELRKLRIKAEIVLTSTNEEFAIEAFALNVTSYLLKPLNQECFDRAMDLVKSRLSVLHSRKIVLKLNGGGIQVVEVDEICYIESNMHKQKVYLLDGSHIEIRQTLLSVRKLLDIKVPGQFVSPNKGILVNQKAIRVIKPDYVEVSGYSVSLAKRKFRQFQTTYFEFIFGGEQR